MLVSTTVVSTRSFRPPVTPCSCANCTIRCCNSSITSDQLPQPRQSLRIGHLLVSDPRKSPIHQIGAHFSLQRVIAPVSNVFQQQQSQHHFCRRLLTPPPAALRISFPLRLINRVQQLLIFQQTVDETHPRFPQVLDILC